VWAQAWYGPKHVQKQTDWTVQDFFYLKYIAEGWQEEGLQIMVACDRKSMVDWLNSRKLIKPMEAHYSLLAAIQELQRQSSITCKIIHVKGHQDL